ncbi:YhgE/Pip family protein [Actinomadura scrupuli]|uniref:YhgE/Pip family protein n=1 Tax=Actinomadura scrupuli TaxID=559629 RepID=UPI003D95DAB3
MRLPALSLGGLELRRFARARMTRIAVAGLVLLPLLYAGLYLWSFWDPTGRLSHLPVAMVVEDRPADAGGRRVTAGADLARQLRDRRIFDWKVVNAAEARQGVESGRYYMSLTIPADFSARIASPDGDGVPAPATLQVHLNDANSYIVGSIARAVFDEVSAAAGAEAIRSYFDKIFVSYGTLHGKLRQAADGAGELAAGAGRAEDGAGRLAAGAGQAADGAGTLHDKLGDARTGAGTLQDGGRQLAAGLGTLNGGAARLAAGSAQVSGGVQQITAIVDQASDTLVPLLQRYPDLIRTSALSVADGADALAEASAKLPLQTRQAVRLAQRARADLEVYLAAHREIPAALRQELRRSADLVVTVAKGIDSFVGSRPQQLAQLSADARTVAALSRKLAATHDLAGQVVAARRQVDRLNAGARQVATGASRLRSGTGQALAGADRLTGGLGTLRSGIGQLSTGAGRLESGVGLLSTGAGRLESGIGDLSAGAGRLRNGLDDGARQVPDYGRSERERRADMMSAPVRLDTTKDNEAPEYGTGFAPFFVPLSLWVGAMIIYMLLRPLNQRALAGTAPAWRVALAGWLPAALIGILQMLVVLAVLHGFSVFGLFRFGLRLQAAHWAGLIAFLALATVTFVAVVQLVSAKFGPIGRVVALVLLMLQLTSAAGTYPIETSPAFFQWIQPFLPMPWVVTGMRHLVSGGSLAAVWQGGAVLSAFLAGALMLTTLTARQNRVWTMKRLHPVLKL